MQVLPIPADIALSDAFEGIGRVRLLTGYSLRGSKIEFERVMGALRQNGFPNTPVPPHIDERYIAQDMVEFTWKFPKKRA